MAFKPGKGTITNQHLTCDGNGRIRALPGKIDVNDTAWNWKRVIDQNVGYGFYKWPHMEKVLKEGSISGGLDTLRPRDLCFFGGEGNANGKQYSSFLVLNQSATNTILFVKSTLGGEVYKTANLTGTTAGWTGVMCCHLHNDPAGNYNYFFAYNSTDGNLVKFVETSSGINIIETFAVGTFGSRKPIFDGTALWMVAGNNLKRITGVFNTGVALAATNYATGTSWSSGMMGMDQGGGVYAYRVTGVTNGTIVRVSTHSPYDVATMTGFANLSGTTDLHFDGRRGMWHTPGLYLNRIPIVNFPTANGATSTFTTAEALNFDNQSLTSSAAYVSDTVYRSGTFSSQPAINFSHVDLVPTTYTPYRSFNLNAQVSFAYTAGRSHVIRQVSQVTTDSTSTMSNMTGFPMAGVPDVAQISYHSTPASLANVWAYRWNRDVFLRSLNMEGGFFPSEHVQFNAGTVSYIGLGFHTILATGGCTFNLPPRPTRSLVLTFKTYSAGNTLIQTTDSSLIDGASTNTLSGINSTRTFMYVASASPPRWTVIG